MLILKTYAILLIFFWALGVGLQLFAPKSKVGDFILEIGGALSLGAMIGMLLFVIYIIWGL